MHIFPSDYSILYDYIFFQIKLKYMFLTILLIFSSFSIAIMWKLPLNAQFKIIINAYKNNLTTQKYLLNNYIMNSKWNKQSVWFFPCQAKFLLYREVSHLTELFLK